jgi:cation diffusion facilitator family transporter
MHAQSVEQWTHEHAFLGAQHDRNERRTWLVVALTAAMMVAEIIGGTLFGSMAVVADGWHMSTHAGALAIAAFAYRFARRHAHDPRFSFGTGKLGELAGFTSAVVLLLVAAFIGYESVARIFAPVAIRYDEALALAVVGLAVNIASAFLLSATHHHGHAHPHGHEHHHHHDDSNLRAAYLHVLADAFTSVLAIAALLAARFFGLLWMDAAVGIVGALVIASWSLSLIRNSASSLLDMVPDSGLPERIRGRLEQKGDRVSDLHLWRVGPGHAALIVSVVSDNPKEPAVYKARLRGLPGLSHVSVEVNRCPHAQPQPAKAG